MKRALLAGLLSLTLAGAARAQEDKGALDEARQHVQRAKVHYDLGEFKEAADEYIIVYRLRPIPALLFNIAQAYRQGGLYEKARQFYKSYLRESPDAKNRPMIEQSIRDMDDLLAKEKRTKEAAPTGVKEPAEASMPGKPGETVAARSADASKPPATATPTATQTATSTQPPGATASGAQMPSATQTPASTQTPGATAIQTPAATGASAATQKSASGAKPAATVAMAAPAKTATPAPAAATSAPAPAPVAEEEGSLLSKWWFWAAVGVVVIGGGGAAATQMGGNAAPGSHFGTMKIFP
jgi:tetratricopeptide (TPR) repeat protein